MSEAMDFLKKTAPSPNLGQAVNKLCEMSVKEVNGIIYCTEIVGSQEPFGKAHMGQN